jgi:hypothetical protein
MRRGRHARQATSDHHNQETTMSKLLMMAALAPYGNCELFSVRTVEGGLRQITHFDTGQPAGDTGCFFGGCFVGAGFQQTDQIFEDPVTATIVLASSCDPLGTNRSGDQIYAMRPNGDALRQLADVSGVTNGPDGSVRVELPGPFAYSYSAPRRR